MKTKDLVEQQEFIQQNKTLAGRLARDMIAGAQQKVYDSGKRPTGDQMKRMTDKMAKKFYDHLLAALEREIKPKNIKK